MHIGPNAYRGWLNILDGVGLESHPFSDLVLVFLCLVLKIIS